jgi:type I restriction enzyme, S subunit
MKYEMVKLGEICTVVGGTTPNTNKNEYWNGDNIWLSPVDLPEVGSITAVSNSQRKITDLAVKETSLKLLPIGSLVFSSRASIGKIGIVEKPLYTNQGFTNFIPHDKLDVKFLAYALKVNLPKIEKLGNTTTFKEVSRTALKDLEIPLPPLSIQREIATLLDKADALRRKDRELLHAYEALAQAIFMDMFGDPVKNEKGWEVNSVITHCDCIVPGRDKPKSFTGNIPWVTTEDLNHLGLTNTSKKQRGLTKDEIKEVNARIIPIDSIIMTCVGDLGVITINTEEMIINQQLHAFQCKETILPIFLMYVLSYQKDYMYKMASSTTVAYMNKTVCNSIPIICPSIDFQIEFSNRIQKIIDLKNNVLDEINYSESLFQTLLQTRFAAHPHP